MSRPGRGPTAALLLGALVAALLALAGCASTAPPPPRQLPTASDQTDADRRARVRLELAGAYYLRGQYDTALDEVKLALQISPQLADAYNLRGLVYAAIGEEALAEDSFRQALQLAPGDGNVLHNRGWLMCQRGRFGPAQVQFQAALEQPNYRDVVRTLQARGICYGRAAQWPEAEQALMRAYEIDPSDPATGYSLAEVLYRRGEYERARFYIGRVNDNAEALNAQSLWLALRIARKLGRGEDERLLGPQLKSRFPQSPEAALFDGGRFDD